MKNTLSRVGRGREAIAPNASFGSHATDFHCTIGIPGWKVPKNTLLFIGHNYNTEAFSIVTHDPV